MITLFLPLLLFLFPLASFSQCPPFQYYNLSTSSCSNCHESCETCSGPEPHQCLTLKPSNSTERDLLLFCDSSCLTCLGSGPYNCLLCNTNRVFSNGLCVLDCDPSCLTCSETDLDYCLSCNANKTLRHGRCRSYTCDSSCLTCDGPDDDDCLTCPPGKILTNDHCLTYSCDNSCSTCSGPNANQCLSCPSGRILDGNNQCVPYACDSSCSTCYGPDDDQCLTCSSNRTWDNGQCVLYTCDSSCLTCSGPGNDECLACHWDRIMVGNRCETYICDESCLTCSGPSQDKCLTCSSDRILTGTRCETYSCDESCLTCSGPGNDECLTCNSDRIMVGERCETFTCDESCLTCSGPGSNQCLSCASDRILIDHQCEVYSCDESCLTCSGPGQDECSTCNSDRILTGTRCEIYSCDESCLTCSGPNSNQCLSCSSPKVLSSNGTCLKVASQPHEVCHSTCFDCTGPKESQCVSCKENLYFLKGYCYNKCPAGYYSTKVSGSLVCQPEFYLDVQASYIGGDVNQAVLTFNQSLKSLYSELITNLNISLVFIQSQTPISYNYTISSASDKQIIINFSFEGHLIPNNILSVSLPDQVQTETNIFVFKNNKFSLNLPEYYPYSQSQKEMIKTTAAVASVGSSVNSIYSVGSSFVFKSLHSLRSELIDSMINYFIFMNIDFPPNFVAFAEENIGEPGGIIPNFFTPILSEEREQENNSSVSFLKQNMTFLWRYGSKLSFFIVMLGVIFCLENIFKFVSKKLSSKHPIIKILKYLSLSLRWNFLISEVIADFQESTFSSIYGLDNAKNQIDRFASVVGFLLTFAWIITLYFLAKKVLSFHRIRVFMNESIAANGTEENELDRYETLHKAIKANKLPNLLFFSFLLLRSFGFSLVLVLASKTPIVQLAYLFISTLAMITYLLVYVPIKQKNQLFLTIGYEIMLLISIGLAIAIYVYSRVDINAIENRSNLGFVMMFVSMGMIMMNIASFFIELYELKDLLIKYRQKKRGSKIVPTDVGSINNSTLMMSKITAGRSSLIFSKVPLKKSLSQQKLMNTRQMMVVKTGGSETMETVSDVPLPPQINRENTLEEIEEELQRKGKLKLMIRKNYKLMNSAIIKTISDSKYDQETSIHVIDELEDKEKELDFHHPNPSRILQVKRNTSILETEPNKEMLNLNYRSRGALPSSMNDVPTSMIFDSVNQPDKKLRSLVKSQTRLGSKVFTTGIAKTLPDIDEI